MFSGPWMSSDHMFGKTPRRCPDLSDRQLCCSHTLTILLLGWWVMKIKSVIFWTYQEKLTFYQVKKNGVDQKCSFRMPDPKVCIFVVIIFSLHCIASLRLYHLVESVTNLKQRKTPASYNNFSPNIIISIFQTNI